MVFRWVLTPAVLAWAKRTGSDFLSVVDTANSCEKNTFSNQDVSAWVVRAATNGATEVCFKVHRSLKYSQKAGQKFGKLNRGEFECVQLTDQIETTKRVLTSLATGEVVRLRRSSNWVVCLERNDCHVNEVTLERPVTVMKLGREASRTVKGTQDMTAKYMGWVKQDEALLLTASDVTATSEEDLACFRIRNAQDYVISSPSDTSPVGRLENNQKICIRLEDLSPEAQTVVGSLEAEDPVSMNWAHELVVYEWKNGDGSTSTENVWEFTVELQKRAKKTVEQ